MKIDCSIPSVIFLITSLHKQYIIYSIHRSSLHISTQVINLYCRCSSLYLQTCLRMNPPPDNCICCNFLFSSAFYTFICHNTLTWLFHTLTTYQQEPQWITKFCLVHDHKHRKKVATTAYSSSFNVSTNISQSLTSKIIAEFRVLKKPT